MCKNPELNKLVGRHCELRNHPPWGAVAESIEQRPRMREMRIVPGQFNTVTYKIDTCRFLAWHSALIG